MLLQGIGTRTPVSKCHPRRWNLSRQILLNRSRSTRSQLRAEPDTGRREASPRAQPGLQAKPHDRGRAAARNPGVFDRLLVVKTVAQSRRATSPIFLSPRAKVMTRRSPRQRDERNHPVLPGNQDVVVQRRMAEVTSLLKHRIPTPTRPHPTTLMKSPSVPVADAESNTTLLGQIRFKTS